MGSTNQEGGSRGTVKSCGQKIMEIVGMPGMDRGGGGESRVRVTGVAVDRPGVVGICRW